MNDLYRALMPIVAALHDLGVAFQIGGSLASSLHGVPRSTLDVDIVVALEQAHVDGLIQKLQDEYYLDRDALRAAIAGRTCCNSIHLPTMVKVDLFVPKQRPFDREAFSRVHCETLEEMDGSRVLPFATAEDMILHKLDWYRLGEGMSERQWHDVLGMLRVQRSFLDLAYLRRWAQELELSGLLERALLEARQE